MGQRTAIILQVDRKLANDNETKRDTQVFYHQWGYGRVLPSQLLSMLYATMSISMAYNEESAELVKPQGCANITQEYEEATLNALDFTKPQEVGEMLQKADNNNGGVFVRITSSMNEAYEETNKVEYAFMLGSDDGGEYNEFVCADDWLNTFGDYIDDTFRDIFYQTLEYFDAMDMAFL